ncbi:Tetratricopeptide repeat-containing protein [Kosakonia arachidis]|uniref:Tetratricopeptide repeat-containing protein n=1 Tax=Kosakonia arachidis TaxID=551989 RepID=A0A1I7ECD0_9ENTR|nr:tetratricopeptide repeat protein [Kosakonia arachidis]SFU21525.1 Tetratricopeptide repeat-containing protein [Kosakonia arachidis]
MKQLSHIDEKLENEIVFIVESGNIKHDDEKLDEALSLYIKSWSLIPEPKLEWDISNWVTACLYSVYFDLGNFTTSKEWGEISLKTRSSDIDTSPLIDLGMVCYELGQYDEAIKYFDDAYQYGKNRAFQDRPKKYLDYYLKNRVEQ